MTVGLCCASQFNFVPAGWGRVVAKCRLYSNHVDRKILYSHMSLTFIVRAVTEVPELTAALRSTATVTPSDTTVEFTHDHEQQDSSKYGNTMHHIYRTNSLHGPDSTLRSS
jgi:hypothetical protein